MRLTKRAIDAMTWTPTGTDRSTRTTKAKDIRWDDSLPGFGVQLFPSGRKSFVLSYRLHGRKRQITLGQYGVLTLQQARDDARAKLVDVKTGKDPLMERKQALHGETVNDLCEDYLERHAKPNKKSWKTDKQRIDDHILPAWKNLKVTAVTKSDVAALHTKVGRSTPYMANRLVALISKIFELAKTWGFCPQNHPNPARGIPLFEEQKRDRWITPQELPNLVNAIEAEKNIYVRGVIWLYLLTGARKKELLGAEWRHVDEKNAALFIPETKSTKGKKKSHWVPLSTPAIQVLEAMPKVEGNPYVFVGRVKGAHLVNIDKNWRAIRKTAGVDDVRLHDLRRTVGSWLAQSGASLHLIGRVLNHSRQSTTAVYAHFAQDHVKAALDDHGDRLIAAGGKGVRLPHGNTERLKLPVDEARLAKGG